MEQNQQTRGGELWTRILQEMAGIELLWTVVEKLYTDQEGRGWNRLAEEAGLFHGLTKNVYIESILLRVARLMDPARTGQFTNLSLWALADSDPAIAEIVAPALSSWSSSNLDHIRKKFLAHNDQAILLAADPHTINVPMDVSGSEALASLVSEILGMRTQINTIVHGNDLVESTAIFRITQEVGLVERTLDAGREHCRAVTEEMVRANT